MRDNHQGYPEILDAYERDGGYFAVVRVTTSGDAASFEFGVEQQGYTVLRRILNTRPFDRMPGIAYRYFFTGSVGRQLDKGQISIGIRVDQGRTGKIFDFDCPNSLASNLLWFQSLTDLKHAAALKRVGV